MLFIVDMPYTGKHGVLQLISTFACCPRFLVCFTCTVYTRWKKCREFHCHTCLYAIQYIREAVLFSVRVRYGIGSEMKHRFQYQTMNRTSAKLISAAPCSRRERRFKQRFRRKRCAGRTDSFRFRSYGFHRYAVANRTLQM